MNTTSGRCYAIAKRAIDLVLACVALIVSLPIGILIAVAIKLESRGPAMFRQVRVGRDGSEFVMVKFRTMIHNNDPSLHADYYRRLIDGNAESRSGADGEEVFLLDDPRLTRVGRLLRKTSVDELPNLFNVLAGSMSLVGPRPPIPYEVEMYDVRALKRLSVKPGMTGLAQISGRGSLSFREIVELDLRYIETRSLRGDLGIMLRTVPAVLRMRGV